MSQLVFGDPSLPIRLPDFEFRPIGGEDCGSRDGGSGLIRTVVLSEGSIIARFNSYSAGPEGSPNNFARQMSL